ncbi:MAG TPA: ABC transporter permease [Candidatus Acidoferrales bacterium]|nr:ABC transporter permease [Candidatus Acidoferrales bacterium]
MKSFVRDTVAITEKELKQLRRDPVSLILTIMFPILLIGIFIVIVSAFSATTHNVPVVVADLDGTPASNALLNELTKSRFIHVTQLVQTEDQAYQAVANAQAIGAIIIPQGFGAALATGNAFVIVSTDNSKLTSSTFVSAAVNQGAQDLVNQVSLEGGVNFGLKLAPIEVITRPLSGRPPSGDPILPGFLGMIAILGGFDDIVNAISRERERGTFPRLTLSPVSLFAVYSGKMFATVVLTILRTALMLVIFSLYGLVIRGSLILIFLTTILIAVFTLSLGLTMSTRIRGSATLTVLEIAMTFPLFTLAGTTNSPLLLAPGGRAIADSLPWTYGNDALRRLIYLGAGLNAIAGDLIILLVSSLILMPIAISLSKRTM